MGVGILEKASTAAVPQMIKCDTIFDGWKWDQFVRAAGLERASLDEYYLGKIVSNATESGCKKLFANLFSDAVSSGAVFLPSPYTHDDFTFEIQERNRGVVRGVPVRIVLKGKSQIRRAFYGNSNKIFSN